MNNHNGNILLQLIRLFSLGFSLFVLSMPVSMAEKGSSAGTQGYADIKITGSVVLPPPCAVNDDEEFIVEFGGVLIERIDGIRYQQVLPISITCEGDFKGQLLLSLNGESALSAPSTLETSTPGLGLKIQRDGEDFALNSWVKVGQKDQFTLTAVPVTLSETLPVAGEFTASATLVLKQE